MRTPLLIVALLLGSIALVAGCAELQEMNAAVWGTPTAAQIEATNAKIETLSTKLGEEKTIIDNVYEKLEAVALQTADMQNMSAEDRGKLAADLERLEAIGTAAEDRYGTIFAALEEVKNAATPEEKLDAKVSIGQAVAALLPYPLNVIAGMGVVGLLTGEGVRRKKNGQMEGIVGAFTAAAKSDGNGGYTVQADDWRDANKRFGVAERVSAIRDYLATA
jgi:hypothetical protein